MAIGTAEVLDLTSFEAALKFHYKPHTIKNMVYRNNPTLGMLPKYERFGGRSMPLPIRYGVPQGRSATFGKALVNKRPSKFKEFVITRVSNYCLANIDNETLLGSVGDVNAFMRAAVSEIDGALHSATRDLALDVFKSGTGARGVLATQTVDTTLLLATVDDVVNFEVGMILVASAADGGALGSTEATEITAVDRDAGVLTVSPNPGAAGAFTHKWVQGDYLYVEGDAQNGGTKLKLSGFEAWIPATAPTGGDSHFGADRSTDPVRLAGVRHDGSSETHEECLISASAKAFINGGRPDVVVMNPQHFANLCKELGSKVVYDSQRSYDMADISFDGVRVHTPSGSVKVIPDPNCPVGVAWMLQLDTWSLNSLGPAPRILTYEGNRMLRDSQADAVELRVGYYAQLGCTAPGWNVRITLPSLT